MHRQAYPFQPRNLRGGRSGELFVADLESAPGRAWPPACPPSG